MLERSELQNIGGVHSTDPHDFLKYDGRLAAVYKKVETLQDREAGHDLGHLVRVARIALWIGDGEASSTELIAAALLHDLINLPKDSADRKKASELSSELARDVLREASFLPAECARIGDAIRDHSFSRAVVPTSELGRILQDADRLDALGSIGILRAATIGERLGCMYYDLNDPWALTRELDDSRFTVDHFFIKLRNLPEAMHTETGRLEALRRLQFMRLFLQELAREIKIAMPDRF